MRSPDVLKDQPSSRNRLAAYQGSLQMMAEKPVLGFGWKRFEIMYDQFYKSVKRTEAASVQLNDWFTIGTALGVPALACFVAFIYFSLVGVPESATKTIYRAAAIVFLPGFFFSGGLFKMATAIVFWTVLELGQGSEENEGT